MSRPSEMLGSTWPVERKIQSYQTQLLKMDGNWKSTVSIFFSIIFVLICTQNLVANQKEFNFSIEGNGCQDKENSTSFFQSVPIFFSLKNIIFLLDIPQSVLNLGSSLNGSNIKEGDDVYFECSVRANPKPYKISWRFNVSTKPFFLKKKAFLYLVSFF